MTARAPKIFLTAVSSALLFGAIVPTVAHATATPEATASIGGAGLMPLRIAASDAAAELAARFAGPADFAPPSELSIIAALSESARRVSEHATASASFARLADAAQAPVVMSAAGPIAAVASVAPVTATAPPVAAPPATASRTPARVARRMPPPVRTAKATRSRNWSARSGLGMREPAAAPKVDAAPPVAESPPVISAIRRALGIGD